MAGKIRYILVPLDGKARGERSRAAAAAGRLAGAARRLLRKARGRLSRDAPRD